MKHARMNTVNTVNFYWAANPNTRFFILFFFYFNVIHTHAHDEPNTMHESSDWNSWLIFNVQPVLNAITDAKDKAARKKNGRTKSLKRMKNDIILRIRPTIREIAIAIEFVSMEAIFFYAFAKCWSHQDGVPSLMFALCFVTSHPLELASRNLFFLIGFNLAVIWLRLLVKCVCVCFVQFGGKCKTRQSLHRGNAFVFSFAFSLHHLHGVWQRGSIQCSGCCATTAESTLFYVICELAFVFTSYHYILGFKETQRCA